MQTRTKFISIVIVAVLVVAAIYGVQVLREPFDLESPPPIVLEDLPDSEAPLATSVVEAPILYDLAPALTKLEAARW